jgi:VWFA-related protein
MVISALRIAACCALATAPVLAQQQEQEPEPAPIRVNVTEVVVPVTVTDQNGRFVTNLKQSDFHIYDEGVEQEIRFFSAERSQPVVTGFLVDLSSASRVRWDNYKEVMVEMALSLLPGGDKFYGYLIGFNQTAELLVDTTNDPEAIVAKLDRISPGGGAAFYDAIYLSITNRKLVAGEPLQPRRVIVVLGDGHDSASSKTLDQVVELAQRSLTTIYAISTEAYGYTSDSSKNLRRLAEETGGRVVYPFLDIYDNVQGFLSRPSDEGNFEFKVGTGGYTNAILSQLFKAVTAITGEITTQYVLRYVTTVDADSAPERRIDVRVEIPNVVVRARRSYFPNNPVQTVSQ